MHFTNEQILQAAMRQSAWDAGCSMQDFLQKENVIALSAANPRAKKCLPLPSSCTLISYGNNIVASIDEKYRGPVSEYISRFPAAHCFEPPGLYLLNDALAKGGLKVCFMAEYFLPDLGQLKALSCPYEIKILHPCDFGLLYGGPWKNALSESRRQLDVLGAGAYEGERLIGLAACSADCESMWQIGVDVLPPYRHQGIAAALTSRLAMEILERGKVPFYCAAWSNLASVRNAMKCGFRPAWIELTAKNISMVSKMNGVPLR